MEASEVRARGGGHVEGFGVLGQRRGAAGRGIRAIIIDCEGAKQRLGLGVEDTWIK